MSKTWVKRLLDWYTVHQRTMPWRGHSDSYAVWVSEIMLQQTQVDTVRPYFERFLKVFPTIQTLAAAKDEPLLKAWEGLGYYTRVRNLRKAAQQLVAENKALLPETPEALCKLPGIGAYTAAAISSICFHQSVPVVDGNVARVFARRNALRDDFKKEAPRKMLATWLLPYIQSVKVPGDFNQAMMELGALICTPSTPDCQHCPLRSECNAFAHHAQSEYPVVTKAKALPKRRRSVVLLRSEEGALLLQKHVGERLLAGFWELPDRKALPLPSQQFHRLGTYKQTFSHFHLTLTIHTAAPIPRTTFENLVWCETPASLPLTTATRKILATFEQ
ncbi:MAG: A/G-specific adenine glycosylase [Kiritimatiellia bacterium]